MAELNTVQVPDPFASIQRALGIRALQQQIQTGAYEQQTAQATAQQAQQKNSELAAVGNLTKQAYTSGRYKADDGSFDNQKFADDVAQVAPTYGQEISKSATMRAGELYQNQQSLFNLDASKRARMGTTAAALAADPNLDHSQFINWLEQTRKENANNPDASRMLTSFATAMPQDSAGLRQGLRTFAAMAGGDPQTLGLSSPAMGSVQTKDGMQFVNSNPQAPGGVGAVGAPIQNAPAPALGTTPGGQAAVIGPKGVNVLPSVGASPGNAPTPSGTPAPQSPAAPQVGPQAASRPAVASPRPRIAADDAPPANAPAAVQNAYAASVQQAQADVKSARDADANYGASVHVSSVIRQLGKNTDTGPGTAGWHQLLAGIPGAVSSKANDAGGDYQVINSMLDRQAAMARQSMGLPGTNAGAEDSKNLTGTTEFTPGALATKNNLTQALTEGAHQYRQGLEKVGGFTATPSPNAVNKYKADWTANFDPNVYRAMRAHDEGDKDEINALQKELGPKGFQALSVKARNLESLSTTGYLPQQGAK